MGKTGLQDTKTKLRAQTRRKEKRSIPRKRWTDQYKALAYQKV
jgi:hypothetical protein